MIIWVLAKKELRLLARDRLSAILLVVMPLLFVLILGLLLGEGFGQKPDHSFRVTIADLDEGYTDPEAARSEALALLRIMPEAGVQSLGVMVRNMSALAVANQYRAAQFPYKKWSEMVKTDLVQTAGISVEVIGTTPQDFGKARQLCNESKRPAVLVFRPDFSKQVHRCSFLATGINPFDRDGVKFGEPRHGAKDSEVGVTLVIDETQDAASAIIEQVAQVSLLRVLLPWMIGRAFEKLSDPSFLSLMASEAQIPQFLLTKEFKTQMGNGVKSALKQLFSKYELTGKTWTDLTRSQPKEGSGTAHAYVEEGGSGPLQRGAARYQLLVPSYTVMFAFSLVLTVGWLFVSERRQGTMKRLRAAPLTRGQILLGKFLPCMLVSLVQGLLLLAAGNLVFGMRLGPAGWGLDQQLMLLLPVVGATSLAAMGMALMVAALARTEIQVALAGALLVLVLGLLGGCVIPRAMMPEQAQQFTLLTPHGWALDAYRELLLRPEPNLTIVIRACLVLTGFGAGFLSLAWWLLRLE